MVWPAHLCLSPPARVGCEPSDSQMLSTRCCTTARATRASASASSATAPQATTPVSCAAVARLSAARQPARLGRRQLHLQVKDPSFVWWWLGAPWTASLMPQGGQTLIFAWVDAARASPACWRHHHATIVPTLHTAVP
jgi:hypothetical protein